MYSVIIPAYNCENTIEEALDSVINQSRYDLITEIIIINDGSEDNTENVILNYIKKDKNSKIRYFSQNNHGVSYTRNRAIRMANDKWIALIDADDIWLSNKIERQTEVVNGNSEICFLGSIYPFKILLRKKYSGLIKLTPKQLCIRNMPSTPSVIFKKDIGIELGLFNEEQNYGEDIRFFQKFLLKDSYYILVDNLIKISIGKKFFAQSGLSSNLKKMHEGRKTSIRELYELGLINNRFKIFISIFNEFKYIRRVFLRKLNVKGK